MDDEYQLHLENKDLAQAMRKNDIISSRQKNNKTLCVGNFDYEKVLTCPRGDASILYYKRQLSVANFTVTDCGPCQDYCYVYDETTAKKGPKEVASFLKLFVEGRVRAGFRKIILYCDNCGGQNKNHYVPAILLWLAAKFGIEIVLRLLETGHSWNFLPNAVLGSVLLISTAKHSFRVQVSEPRNFQTFNSTITLINFSTSDTWMLNWEY